jgi:hypothetical protein
MILKDTGFQVVDRVIVAQGRGSGHWLAVMNTIINLRFTKRQGISQQTSGSSRRALFHTLSSLFTA